MDFIEMFKEVDFAERMHNATTEEVKRDLVKSTLLGVIAASGMAMKNIYVETDNKEEKKRDDQIIDSVINEHMKIELETNDACSEHGPFTPYTNDDATVLYFGCVRCGERTEIANMNIG